MLPLVSSLISCIPHPVHPADAIPFGVPTLWTGSSSPEPGHVPEPSSPTREAIGNVDSLRIGVDLGGTKIEAVLVRATRGPTVPDVLARLRRPTERERGYEHVLSNVAQIICDVAAQAGISPSSLPPIGVGMPGAVTRAGVVKNSNTTCLNGRPFRSDLIRRVGAPISFANDANCFALAEATYGAGRGHELVFGVILGTGVGGGIVLCDPERQAQGQPGRSWNGPQGIAGEWGHVTLDPDGPPCYCGRRGCVETYLCGPALEGDYARRSGQRLPLVDIAQRAEQGHDSAAIATLRHATQMFGRALACVVNILDPDVIVLGGGVSHLDCWYGAGRTEVARWVFSDELTTPIVRYQISDSAGVLGAALLPGVLAPSGQR